jgi:hypothetical protein
MVIQRYVMQGDTCVHYVYTDGYHTVLTAMHCTGSYRGLGSMVWNLGPDPDPADGTEEVEDVEG